MFSVYKNIPKRCSASALYRLSIQETCSKARLSFKCNWEEIVYSSERCASMSGLLKNL